VSSDQPLYFTTKISHGLVKGKTDTGEEQCRPGGFDPHIQLLPIYANLLNVVRIGLEENEIKITNPKPLPGLL
jgi:hypothetical protein